MKTERRGCIRRREDKDLLESIAVNIIKLQTDVKLLKGNDELIIFRLSEIEEKLNHHET